MITRDAFIYMYLTHAQMTNGLALRHTYESRQPVESLLVHASLSEVALREKPTLSFHFLTPDQLELNRLFVTHTSIRHVLSKANMEASGLERAHQDLLMHRLMAVGGFFGPRVALVLRSVAREGESVVWAIGMAILTNVVMFRAKRVGQDDTGHMFGL
ncbi:hypothetical protein Q7P37_005874 [Cladosporium fusiforme]